MLIKFLNKASVMAGKDKNIIGEFRQLAVNGMVKIFCPFSRFPAKVGPADPADKNRITGKEKALVYEKRNTAGGMSGRFYGQHFQVDLGEIDLLIIFERFKLINGSFALH